MRSRRQSATAAFAALLCGGCALLGGERGTGLRADGSPRGRDLVRAEAPADYDLLVAQQLQMEGRHPEAAEAFLRAVAKDPESAYLQRKAAAALAQQGRLDDALPHAQRAVELDPDDDSSRVFLGQLFRLRRQGEEAESVLRDAEGAPRSADAAFLLYQLHAEAERLEEAERAARWLAENEPERIRGTLALATVYFRMERPEDAETVVRHALEREPDNLRLYGALARMLRQRGAHREEIALYDEILDRFPQHHATLVALGEAQLAQEDLEGAIETFRRLEERYPEDLDSSERLGYLLFEARRYQEARERFERVSREKAGPGDVEFFLAVVRRRTGDVAGALEAFHGIPEEHRYFAEARAQIASIYERRGEYASALEEVQRAQRASPSQELDIYAANLRAKTGDLDGAVGFLEVLLAEEPENDDLLFNLGVIYGEARRTEEAIRYMQLALEKNPDNASALNYIGYTWAERGKRLDEAEELIRRAIELRPDDGYIVDSLGWVYYMRARPLVEGGQSADAKPWLRRALSELERAAELTGGDPVISEHLGDTYLLLDQKQRALEKFEEALQLEPRRDEQPDLHEKLESLRRELR